MSQFSRTPSDYDYAFPTSWPFSQKIWVTFILCYYTFVVYLGSSIIVPTYEQMIARYGISYEICYLSLALYIVGYGIGPLIFSPISEIPEVGRNPPYIVSFVFFFIVSIILPVVNNYPTIVFLRFLQGFFGSPCLASGGATIQDVFGISKTSMPLVSWILSFYCGPALGPPLASYSLHVDSKMPLWEIVIVSAPLFVALIFLLPETSQETLLLHNNKTSGHLSGYIRGPRKLITQLSMVRDLPAERLKSAFKEAIFRPLQIAIQDPAVAFGCIYSSYVYGIYYTFFEAIPLTYPNFYDFSSKSTSLIYLSMLVGGVTTAICYLSYALSIRHGEYSVVAETSKYEARLVPGLPAVLLVTAGLFIYAFTANSSIHWIAPTIGIATFAGGVFVVFQALLSYLPMAYPRYAASLFAVNDFARSMAGAAVVMFSRKMYLAIGIRNGVTILAGISVLGIAGMVYLVRYGASLRAKSRFTG